MNEDKKDKDLEKEQIKNIYLNTLFFSIISILFGIAYFYLVLR
tara:strand:- start:418 stop:546 length:129 start_codon:yes stop_codon:yes gene_type:complete